MFFGTKNYVSMILQGKICIDLKFAGAKSALLHDFARQTFPVNSWRFYTLPCTFIKQWRLCPAKPWRLSKQDKKIYIKSKFVNYFCKPLLFHESI